MRHALIAVVGLVAAGAAQAGPALTAADYDRAAQYLSSNAHNLVLNGAFKARWRPGPHEGFTWRRELGEGRADFLFVDAATGKGVPAFDAGVVAQGLTKALGRPIDPQKLPFGDFFDAGPGAIKALVDGKTATCSTVRADCALTPMSLPDYAHVASPDGRWIAYVKDHNLWVKSADGAQDFALTTDGEAHNGYGESPENDHLVIALADSGLAAPAAVSWSPDSRHLFAARLDERNVKQVSLTQTVPADGSIRPVTRTWRFAMPGDDVLPMSQPYVFDVATRAARKVGVDAIPTTFATAVEQAEVTWSADGAKAYLYARTRYKKTASLVEINASTGAARTVLTESSSTFVQPAALGQKPLVHVLKSGDVIWGSERDGYARLYLHDGRNGQLKKVLTPGPGLVTGLVRVDEDKGVVFVRMRGREPGSDPYYDKLYRVELASGAPKLITPDDAHHLVFSLNDAWFPPSLGLSLAGPNDESISPSGRYVIDQQTRADLPPKVSLRRTDGTFVADIVSADTSRLAALGFTPPERFKVLAADGVTPIYGIIYRPSRFDPNRRYPVIDNPYPGPQINRVTPAFMSAFDSWGAQAVAELGFIVVTVDGRGTPGRGKAFADLSYSKLSSAGSIEDHVAAYRQLAARYPYMDLDRIGIYGTSGGGYATLNAMLTFPDVYKVGVSDAGNHDQRQYIAEWGETYNGPVDGRNYLDSANAEKAANLKGKLLLMHGEMDWNVLPYQTVRVIDALIKANKDFDYLLVPNTGHGALRTDYARRRLWDYMVRNLLGAEPPQGYAFKPPVQ